MSEQHGVTIGLDLWPAGRLIRIVAGALLLTSLVLSVASGELGPISAMLVAQLVGTGALIAAVYTVAVALLGERLLRRRDPWLAAIILVGPAAVLYFVPSVPGWVIVSFFLYAGMAMIVQAVLNYGGCEVAAFPALLLRRRYTVYCALNSVDVVERSLRGRPRWIAWALAIVVFALVTTAQVGVETIGGRTSAFWPAYLAFLIVGFAARRVAALARRAQVTGPPAPSGS